MAGADAVTVEGEENAIYGGEGDDTFVIEGSANEVYGENNNDTFTINGDDNYTHGGAGDDTFYVYGKRNSAWGGEGTNTIGIGADDVSYSRSDTQKIIALKDEGSFEVKGGNEVEFEIAGKRYSVLGSVDGTLGWKLSNGQIKFEGNNLTIKSLNDQVDNLHVVGANNNIYTYNGNDKVIAEGNNAKVYGGEGSDEIKALGDMVTVYGGEGDDNITAGGHDSAIYGESGNDTINTTGSFKVGAINGGEGNDTITINNINTDAYGDSGNDTIKLFSTNGSAEGGEGNDTVLVDGEGNNIALGEGDDNATILGDSNTVDGGAGFDVIANSGTNTTISNCDILHKEADPFVFQVGTEANSNSTIEVSTGFVLPILGVDISNAESARASLEDIDRVIEALTVKLGEIGVSKNRLESALSANKVAEINIAAARSNIVDADIAKESMELLKAQILQNASASLLTASRDINSTSLLNIYNSIGNLRR